MPLMEFLSCVRVRIFVVCSMEMTFSFGAPILIRDLDFGGLAGHGLRPGGSGGTDRGGRVRICLRKYIPAKTSLSAE